MNSLKECKKNTILVIDDEILSMQLMRHSFPSDHEIILKEDGYSAIQWLKKNSDQLALIICNLDLPNINGYEFIGKIKSSTMYRHIPLLVISSDRSEIVKNKCYRAGVIKFFATPVLNASFFGSVKEILKG